MLRPLPGLSVLLLLLAAEGGPDDEGLVFTSSDEDEGPPHVTLDLGSGGELELVEGETEELEIPFGFD
ncbi:MAG: hypothetical protein QF464_15475, partial [Myxococcota bacterium]|nr:hypothetical protein [Myxococcota bacterium]